MLTKNHEKLTVEVKTHIEADAVMQGTYWDGNHGCFIGCLAHSSDATKLGDRYGLPLPLVRICENIFEALSPDEAKAFFAAIPEAVGRDGKDLTRVHWAFLAAELRTLPQQDVIDTVIEGMDLLAAGEEWSRYAATHAATHAATYAAVHATYAAVHAADAAVHAAVHAATYDAVHAATYAAAGAARAADAADAAADARQRQRDLILKLISDAK